MRLRCRDASSRPPACAQYVSHSCERSVVLVSGLDSSLPHRWVVLGSSATLLLPLETPIVWIRRGLDVAGCSGQELTHSSCASRFSNEVICRISSALWLCTEQPPMLHGALGVQNQLFLPATSRNVHGKRGCWGFARCARWERTLRASFWPCLCLQVGLGCPACP